MITSNGKHMTESSFANPTSILITGASSGIGAALAEIYAGNGITMFLSGRNTERLEAVAQTCREKGAVVHPRTIDVTDTDAMQQWIETCDDTCPLDLVIANAGISGGVRQSPEPSRELARDTVGEEIFAINIDGVLHTVTPALALMRARHRGQVAIMSSLAGLRGLPSAPAYSASKVAVRAYGEALRSQMAPDGIGVCVIMPGFVESRITDQNDFPMPMIMPASKAARIIKRGLAQNKARIAFPWAIYMIMRLVAALPTSIGDRLLARLPKK